MTWKNSVIFVNHIFEWSDNFLFEDSLWSPFSRLSQSQVKTRFASEMMSGDQTGTTTPLRAPSIMGSIHFRFGKTQASTIATRGGGVLLGRRLTSCSSALLPRLSAGS